MKILLIPCPFAALIALLGAALTATGCQSNESSPYVGTPGTSWDGIYVQTIPANVASPNNYDVLTVFVNYPDIEMVVTPNGAATPSFVGIAPTGFADQNGVFTYNLTLNGTNGQAAQATGYLGFTQAGPASVQVNISGGLTYAYNVAQFNATTNALLVGTYSGPYNTSYTVGNSTAAEPAGTVTSATLVADSSTGGYDLNAAGTTSDPSGKPVSFAISNAQVDPAGIISNLKVTYSHPGGTAASVTNTYPTAFVNLGVAANAQGISSSPTLLGYFSASTTQWPGGAAESDSLVLNQTSTTGIRRSVAARTLPR